MYHVNAKTHLSKLPELGFNKSLFLYKFKISVLIGLPMENEEQYLFSHILHNCSNLEL